MAKPLTTQRDRAPDSGGLRDRVAEPTINYGDAAGAGVVRRRAPGAVNLFFIPP